MPDHTNQLHIIDDDAGPSLTGLPLFNDDNLDDDGAEMLSPIAARFTTTTRPATDRFAVPAAKVRHITPTSADSAAVGDLDWDRVQQMRVEVSRLPEMIRAANEDPTLHRQIGRDIIRDHLQAAISADLAQSLTVMDVATQAAMEQAIFDATFGLGRLEPLFLDPTVENIEINGFDDVLTEDGFGNLRQRDPIAASDEELIRLLRVLADSHGRPFSESQPWMHLRLDNHSRLAAMAWVTPRPVVVIRRHRFKHITLPDLVERSTISPNLASFLAAAVRAGRSIVFAGAQGAGKTTLMRAACNEIPKSEPIATFQDVEELFLADQPDRHRVFAAESRPPSGEYTPDGRPAGEITLGQLIEQFFRFNRDRLIVGEVRGREILPMITATQSSRGSLSTTHARDARGAVDKLITCGLQAGASVTEQYMVRALGTSIDLVVFLHLETHGHGAYDQGRRDRFVTEVIELGLSDGKLEVSDVYWPGPDGRAVPHSMSDRLRRELTPFGFDAASYDTEAASHDDQGRRR